MKHYKKYIHQVISALQFYYHAKTLYNIHSPFLYNLLTKLFKYSSEDLRQFGRIERLIQDIEKNEIEFEHKDFGEGSRSLNSHSKKTVKHVLNTSSSNSKKGKILYKLVEFFNPRLTLELGTNLGIGTAYLAAAKADNIITTIEGDSFLAQTSTENLTTLRLKNVEVLVAEFDHFLKSNESMNKFDFIFIDGNHNYDATVRYFDKLYDSTKENQVLVIDDIYWSSDMTRAWNYVQSKMVSGYCLDLFQMGILINSKAIEELIPLKYIRKRWKPLSFGFWG